MRDRIKAWMLAVAAVFSLCAGPSAFASDLADPVPGHPGLTHRDLMRHIILDLAPDAPTGRTLVAARHIAGSSEQSDPPEKPSPDIIRVMAIPDDPTRVILFTALGQSEYSVAAFALLALFTLTPEVKLLDVVGVGSDRFTGPREATPLLAPGAPLIVVDSSHSNSNQSYQSTEMIFVRANRFQLIGQVFTFSEQDCKAQRTQEAAIATASDPGPYRAVQVIVRATVTPAGKDCSEPQTSRSRVSTHQATYRWDNKRERFVTPSRALDQLARQNTKRF